MSNMKFILSSDVEANGLHGEGFAVGGVLLERATGQIVERFYARCPIVGEVDPWVRENVLPRLTSDADAESHDDAKSMRDDYWNWLISRTNDVSPSTIVVMDCGWPVEANFLSACVRDNSPTRDFGGPYPVHEVATLLLAAKLDPKGSYAAQVLSADELKNHHAHHPVDDALVSGRCAIMALDRIQNWRTISGA